MNQKVFHVLFFGLIIILVVLLVTAQPFAAQPEVLLAHRIQADFVTLSEKKLLPPEMYQVEDLLVNPTDPLSQDVAKRLELPIERLKKIRAMEKPGVNAQKPADPNAPATISENNSQKKYRLEILMTSWKEKSEVGMILMYSLEDMDTKNTVWELGRTFHVPFNLWVYFESEAKKKKSKGQRPAQEQAEPQTIEHAQ